jgi:hypothetical protein
MSAFCTLIVAAKLAALASPWAVVPLIYGVGTWGKPENLGDVILSCGAIGMFFV